MQAKVVSPIILSLNCTNSMLGIPLRKRLDKGNANQARETKEQMKSYVAWYHRKESSIKHKLVISKLSFCYLQVKNNKLPLRMNLEKMKAEKAKLIVFVVSNYFKILFYPLNLFVSIHPLSFKICTINLVSLSVSLYHP